MVHKSLAVQKYKTYRLFLIQMVDLKSSVTVKCIYEENNEIVFCNEGNYYTSLTDTNKVNILCKKELQLYISNVTLGDYSFLNFSLHVLGD